jgi:hypothetical protein
MGPKASGWLATIFLGLLVALTRRRALRLRLRRARADLASRLDAVALARCGAGRDAARRGADPRRILTTSTIAAIRQRGRAVRARRSRVAR